jgi:outer membrane protein assembly factor BamB
VVAGDTVYAVGDGEVYAVDRATLEQRWRTSLGGLVTSSPLVSDGALYVGARDGAVYAVDAATGAQLWRFQTGGEISSSPAVVDGRVLIGSGDRRLYCLDTRTGHEVWSAATAGAVDSSPAVAGDEVYVGSFDGGLYCFARSDGAQKWRCELGGLVHASPAVADDVVFVATVRAKGDQVPVFAWVDRTSGEVRGRFELPDSCYSSPTVWAGQVLIGCRDRQVYAFDRGMAQVPPLWTHRTGSYVHASPVVVGDTVLVASFDGYLYALRQARPIAVWTEDDVVPRWFVAAMARQLHRETGELVAKAAAGEVGRELTLTGFDELLRGVKAEVAGGGQAPAVLPRDVPPGHPGAPFIGYALTAGLLGGYPDGTFRPSEPTSRYQFASGLSAVLESVLRPDFVWRALQDKAAAGVAVEVQARPLAARRRIMAGDVDEGHWAYKSLAQLAKQGLLPVDDEGRFRGERVVTLRAAAGQWGLLVESVRVVRVR